MAKVEEFDGTCAHMTPLSASSGFDRDRPDREGTLRLSPHLRFGEISPRQVWHAARFAAAKHRLYPPISKNSSANSAGANSAATCCSTCPISPRAIFDRTRARSYAMRQQPIARDRRAL